MTIGPRILATNVVCVALFWCAARALAEEKTVNVSPGAWVGTGIQLKPGQHFESTATGTITQQFGNEKRESGPDGYYYLGFQAWTLKYKVGDAKDASIGDLGANGFGYSGEKGGALYLGISKTYDPAPDGNVSGSFKVTVYYGSSLSGGGGLNGRLGGNVPGAAGSGSGTPLGPLVAGAIPPLIATLANGKKIFPRRPKTKRPPPKIPFKEDEEDKPPKNPPESPFARDNPRNETPQPCLGFYDDYVNMQKEVLSLEREIRIAAKHYWEAQRRHNQNLAKFTLNLGWDMGNLLAAGVEGVRGAMGIANLIHEIPEMLRKGLQLARSVLSKVVRKISVLMEELAEVGRRVTTLGKAAEQLAEKSRTLTRSVGELAEALSSAEKGLSEHVRFLVCIQDAESSMAERAAIARQLTEAEGRLQSAESALNAKLSRKAALPAEQARLTSEIGEAAKEAEEIAANNAKAEHNAAAMTAEKREPLRRCDNKIRELEKHLNNFDELEKRRTALKGAEDALEKADDELKVAEKNAADMDQAVKEQENWKRLQNEVKDATESVAATTKELAEARRQFQQCKTDIQSLIGSCPNDADGQPVFTHAQRVQLNYLEANEELLQIKVNEAAASFEEAKTHLRDATYRARDLPEDLPAIIGKDLTSAVLKARADLAAAKAKILKLHREWEFATKNFQNLSHAGMNPAVIPELQAELAEQKQLLPPLQAEFNKAFDAEQLVKTQVQQSQARIAALQTRQGELEAALNKAEGELATIAEDESAFNAWRPEIDGQIAEHKGKVTSLDNKINELKARVPGGATKESLQQEISKLQGEIAANKKKITVWNTELSQLKSPLDDANRVALIARAERDAKLLNLKSAEEEKAAAEREVKRLEEEIANRLKNPDLIDQAQQKSKEWSNALKPRVAKALEDKFKSGMGVVGDAWHKLFNGQTPEEVADILVKGRDAVQALLDELNDLLRYRDECMQELRRLRGELEKCRIEHGASTLR